MKTIYDKKAGASWKSRWNIIKGILSHPMVFLKKTGELYDAYQSNYALREVFIQGEYFWLYSRIKPETELIDIGANIGDSAVYFAMNPNVDKVYSYELIPSVYRAALENIESSPYKNKIHLKNAGVNSKRQKVRIESNFRGVASTRLSDAVSGSGVEVDLLTLDDILDKKKRVAIKCDCEGAEATLFDQPDLKNVYAIQLEYHSQEIKSHLASLLKEKGFEVTVMESEGLICAERKH